MSVTETAGFDVITAISQDTVNFQIAQLFKQGKIPNRLDITMADTGISISAALVAPTVDFAALNGTSAVLFSIKMRSGTFTYYDGFGPAAKQQRINFTDWVYAFDVNLSFQQIEQSALQASTVVPDVVKQTLSNFTADMFTIQHLFMDFENADIARYDPARTKMPLPDGTHISPGQLTQWQNAIENYFTSLAGSGNPYILGYAATARPSQLAGGAPPLLNPTGATFSTFRGAPAPGDDTLNFLLMTDGHALPPVPPNGVLSASPISSHDYDGAMVIAPEVFVDGYLEGYVLYVLGDFTGVLKRSGNQWNASSSTDNKNQNDGKGQIVSSLSGTIYLEETQTRSATVTLVAGSKPAIHVKGEFTINAEFYEYPLGIRTWDGSASYTLPWTLDIGLSAGTDGKILATPDFQQDTPIKKADDNIFQKLADVFSLGLSNGLKQAQDWANQIASLASSTMQNNLTSALRMVGQRVILPAGDVFFFSDATLLDDFGLRFDIQYKASR